MKWIKAACAVLFKIAVASDGQECITEDLLNRHTVQNKLAGECEVECKKSGDCNKCPQFASKSQAMSWEELIPHMTNMLARKVLVSKPTKSIALVKSKNTFLGAQSQEACVKTDLEVRNLFQNKMAGVCEEMCKEVGAYPACAQCPAFVPPDSTPGVQTWPELLDHMDNLSAWGADKLKAWNKQASKLLQKPKRTALVSKSEAVAKRSAGATVSAFESRVRNLRAVNPLFSEEACAESHNTKLKLGGGGTVVPGCPQVCDMIRKMKNYWETGDMASFACTKGHAFGCVYDATPPVTMSGIGC